MRAPSQSPAPPSYTLCGGGSARCGPHHRVQPLPDTWEDYGPEDGHQMWGSQGPLGPFPQGGGVEERRGRLSLRPRGEGSHHPSGAGWEAKGTAPLPTPHLPKLPQPPPPRPSRSRICPPRTAFLGVTLHNVARGAGQGVAGQVMGLGPGGGGHEGHLERSSQLHLTLQEPQGIQDTHTHTVTPG